METVAAASCMILPNVEMKATHESSPPAVPIHQVAREHGPHNAAKGEEGGNQPLGIGDIVRIGLLAKFPNGGPTKMLSETIHDIFGRRKQREDENRGKTLLEPTRLGVKAFMHHPHLHVPPQPPISQPNTRPDSDATRATT